MNRNIVKYLGGIATVLMVLSLFSTGAFAFAQDRGMNEDNGHRMGGMEGPAMAEAADFEDLTFEEVQEMMLDHVDNRIERLTSAQDRLDNDENYPLSEEDITDGLAELESLREEITAAEDLDDLDAIRDDLKELAGERGNEMGPGPDGERGMGMDEDFEDLTFEEAQEMMLDHVDNRIERLTSAQDRLDNDENCPLSEEDITDGLAELESLREEIAAAEDLDDLDTIRDDLKELAGERGNEMNKDSGKERPGRHAGNFGPNEEMDE